MTYQVAATTRDVGVTYGETKFRKPSGIICPSTYHAKPVRSKTNLVRQRFDKRKQRMDRIRKVAQVTRHARKLFSGSGFSSSTWGHPVSPLSESMIVQLERDALASTGIKPHGRCRAMALVVAFGLQGTPRSRLVREKLRNHPSRPGEGV